MPASLATLNNGYKVPLVGLGTIKESADKVRQSVTAALDAGYRHIDTACAYQNEETIGEVLKEYFKAGKLKREDVFITTKLFPTHMSEELVPEALDTSLKKLRLDFVDLYLIHSPVALTDTGMYDKHLGVFPVNEDGTFAQAPTDHLSTWRGMEAVVRTGKTKSIGVSNFNARQVKRIIDNCSILPVTNQVECHAYLSQQKLQDYMAEWGILVTAFGCSGWLDKPDEWKSPDEKVLLEDPVIRELASKYKKTPAQIHLRHLVQRNILVIPRSSNPTRIQENFKVQDFTLTEEDMKKLLALDRGFRYYGSSERQEHPEFPFDDEF